MNKNIHNKASIWRMTKTFLNNTISCKFDSCWRKWLWNVLPMFLINYNKYYTYCLLMCGRENDVFPLKFENCVVSTTIKPEQPGQGLRKPQDKSHCRQGGFLTVLQLPVLARVIAYCIIQGYVRERLKLSIRKFYGRYGDLIKQYEVSSPKCYTTFWDMTLYSDTLNWSDITPICELITELDLITDFELPNFGRFP